MIRLRFAAASFAALFVAALACSSDFPSGLHIESINVLLGKSTLAVGQKASVAAVVKDANGNTIDPVAVTWTSSNPAVATVAAAEVTALSAGTTDIAATSDGVTAAATLIVTPAPAVPVATVTVGLNATSLVAGQSTQATAATLDANGAALTGRAIAWSSSNAAVATVSGSGLVVGVGAGTAQITATSEGQSGSATIQVSAAPTSSAPTQLVVAVQPAGAVSGLALSTQPMVQVRDASGNLVSGATNSVTAALSSGSGTLSGTTTVTAASGLASFTNLRIDGAGPHTLSFTSSGLTTASATVTVTQTPASLSIQTQPAGATTGSPLATQPVVRILDNAGLLIANSALVVSSAIASGSGTLTGGPATAVNGVATFANLRVDGTGSVSLAFTTVTPALRATSASFPVAVGAAAKLTLTTQPAATVTSGVALSPQPAVQLRDAANSAVAQSGVVVTAAIASGGGTLGGTATATTNASGVATFSNLSISGTAGARTLSFSATGLTGVTSSSISVSAPAATPTQVTITTQPSSAATSGVALAQQPVLQLRDASNAAVAQSGVVVTAAIASGTGGTLSGTNTATTNASGVATFTNLSIAGSGAYTLGFTASGLTSATSSAVTVSVPPPPPPGAGEPTYTAATDKLLVQDDLNGYTGLTSGTLPFTSRYPNYRVLDASGNATAIGNLVSLVPGRNGTGLGLRLKYGGSTGGSDIVVGTENQLDNIGGWNGTLPQKAGPYSHFFFTTWIRFSVGADPGADPYDSGVKGIMLWHNGGQRYQHAPHRLKDYNGGRYAETRWDAGPPHPPNTTTGLNHWKTSDGAAPKFAPFADGNWHRFTVEIYAADPSGHRGERWWLDGVLVFDNMDNVGSISWGGDYTYTNPITHWMVFGNYVNASAAQASPTFTVDFDDWTAWTK